MKRNPLVRDASIVVAGCLLWFGIASAGTYLTLRYTSAGRLLIDLGIAGGDHRAVESALAGYEDPRTLLMETLPQLFWVLLVSATIAAGVFVGAFASGRSLWPLALAAAAVASLLGFMDPASAANWLRAGGVAIMLWASGFFVMRWRRRRRGAAGPG
jgi:hypothetical protein